MPVKAEHAPHIVHVGHQVTFTMGQHVKELSGKRGVIVEKALKRFFIDTREVRENIEVLGYLVRVIPPAPSMPAEVWCWRCGFEVIR